MTSDDLTYLTNVFEKARAGSFKSIGTMRGIQAVLAERDGMMAKAMDIISQTAKIIEKNGLAAAAPSADREVLAEEAKRLAGLFGDEMASFATMPGYASLESALRADSDCTDALIALHAAIDRLRDATPAKPQADAPSESVDESELEDMAHAATQEALSSGLSVDVIHRHLKTLYRRMSATPTPVAQAEVPNTFKLPGESDDQWIDRITGATPTTRPRVEPFVVRYYMGDPHPCIKGNGFDGLLVGEAREEAEKFVTWINDHLNTEAP